MTSQAPFRTVRSVCPHDCPSSCALDVDLLDDKTIGRVRGAKDDPYTAGVICEKVARYAERIHHAERLLYPLRRAGKKGEGNWQRISWDEALDEIAARFKAIEDAHGPEAIWPYFYAGTMGHVQRDSIDRLRHIKGWSNQGDTICTTPAWAGYVAGTGMLTGVNPEHMVNADCVVIWGTNPVHTQVNVMTHAIRARKENGAKIAVVDIHRSATMQQADLGIVLRPGTDGAFATAIMHILLRDGLADRDYLARLTDFSPDFEAHLADKSPEWAAKITGLEVSEIEEFAALVGQNKNTFFRLGYGFTRQRNGAVGMHAALCIPAMTGAWQHPGGGAFHSHSGMWALDKNAITAKDQKCDGVRILDMSRIGPVLNGESEALQGGGPVMAMLIQNTNPACVAPDQSSVREGFKREDLFTVVHEQFMTETAELADIVLPASMFLEHDDYYTRGGHNRILLGPKVMDAPGEARPNIFVINEVAKRLGLDHPSFHAEPRELIAETFRRSNYPSLEEVEKHGAYVDRSLPHEKAHFLSGFGWPDGKFRFEPNWEDTRHITGDEWAYPPSVMPRFPDHFEANEPSDADHPFRLATSPARAFLNSSFNMTGGSRKREGGPSAMIHSSDASTLGIGEGDRIQIGNRRGQVILRARIFDGMQTGTIIVESLHRNSDHEDGQGINTLIGADPIPPFGGAAFHDCAVWVRPAN